VKQLANLSNFIKSLATVKMFVLYNAATKQRKHSYHNRPPQWWHMCTQCIITNMRR